MNDPKRHRNAISASAPSASGKIICCCHEKDCPQTVKFSEGSSQIFDVSNMYTCPSGKANNKSGKVYSPMCFAEGHVENMSNFICKGCQKIKTTSKVQQVTTKLDLMAELKTINNSGAAQQNLAGNTRRLADTTSTSSSSAR